MHHFVIACLLVLPFWFPGTRTQLHHNLEVCPLCLPSHVPGNFSNWWKRLFEAGVISKSTWESDKIGQQPMCVVTYCTCLLWSLSEWWKLSLFEGCRPSLRDVLQTVIHSISLVEATSFCPPLEALPFNVFLSKIHLDLSDLKRLRSRWIEATAAHGDSHARRSEMGVGGRT